MTEDDIRLIKQALDFAVLAAGEGISIKTEQGVDLSPEKFLLDYSTETGFEDWGDIPKEIERRIRLRKGSKA